MAHISASLQVSNAIVDSWNKSSGNLAINQPVGVVTVQCVAEAKPTTVTYNGSHATLASTPQFYIGERETIRLTANSGYRFDSQVLIEITNSKNPATSVSSDGKYVDITFTPTALSCEISGDPDSKYYTITMNYSDSFTGASSVQVPADGTNTINILPVWGYYAEDTGEGYNHYFSSSSGTTITYVSGPEEQAEYDGNPIVVTVSATSNGTISTESAEPHKFRVIYDEGTGTGSISDTEVIYTGTSTTLTLSDGTGMSKQSYKLNNWLEDSSETNYELGSTHTINNSFFIGCESPYYELTMTAQWVLQKYTVTLSKNIEASCTVHGSGEYVSGQTITVYADLNDGYSFVGWYENGTLKSSDSCYTFSVVGNRTLEARCEDISTTYTVCFDDSEVTTESYSGELSWEYNDRKLEQGESITLSAGGPHVLYYKSDCDGDDLNDITIIPYCQSSTITTELSSTNIIKITITDLDGEETIKASDSE